MIHSLTDRLNSPLDNSNSKILEAIDTVHFAITMIYEGIIEPLLEAYRDRKIQKQDPLYMWKQIHPN